MSPDVFMARIVAEIDDVGDWVSVADAMKLMGINSWSARRCDVRFVLDCVNRSDRLQVGRVETEYRTIPKPIPVENLLNHIFDEEDPADRSALMMQLFISIV